jgi:CHAD domain-containing protein
MKAKKVKGLKPSMPLGAAAERIVQTRLAEIEQLAPAALADAEPGDTHDLRIAVKRLRYVLDATSPVLGPYAENARKHLRRLQDVLGEVQDCDVLVARAETRQAELHAHDIAAMIAHPKDPAAARHRTAYRGLAMVSAHFAARRAFAVRRFRRAWHALEREEFAAKLRAASRGGAGAA